MKKIMSLLLVVVLALSMAACGTNNPNPSESTNSTTAPTTQPTTEATEPSTEPSTEATEPSTEDTEATEPSEAAGLYMIMMTCGDNAVTLYDDDMGGMYVDLTWGGVRKVTTLDASVLVELNTVLQSSGLVELNGASEYGEGEQANYLYASYTDWTSISADYYGVDAPEAFVTGFNAVASYLETLLADVEEYVPVAAVFGEVNATLLAEMQAVVNNSGLPNLDALAITDIVLDEYFGYTAGLTSAEGVSAAAICQNQMMGGAVYQLVMVTVEDTAAVAADFEANIDWLKWVCVQPSNAIIATKDNMVLCLLADASMYGDTVSAMAAAGWTTVTELSNPNM